MVNKLVSRFVSRSTRGSREHQDPWRHVPVHSGCPRLLPRRCYRHHLQQPDWSPGREGEKSSFHPKRYRSNLAWLRLLTLLKVWSSLIWLSFSVCDSKLNSLWFRNISSDFFIFIWFCCFVFFTVGSWWYSDEHVHPQVSTARGCRPHLSDIIPGGRGSTDS